MKNVVIAVAGLGVLAALAVGAGYGYIVAQGDAAVDATSTEAIVFEVPKGANFTKVGRLLEKEGLIADATLWKLYFKLNPPKLLVKAGKHTVTKAMSMRDLSVVLTSKPMSEDVPLTMVEGWRLVDADEWLAANGSIDAGEYVSAASKPADFNVPFELGQKNLEGFLLPETYMVPKGKLDVHKLIQRQIDGFNERFVKPFAADIEKSGRTMRDIVIMASMLEREEPKPEVRPMVAGVLYKRIDAKSPLGVDATSRYTLEDWNVRSKFLAKLRDPKDPYNTRLKSGFPPTPIGAPSIESLRAAVHPKKNPYWYYLHDKTGTIHYGRNGAEHEKNRRIYNVY